MRYENSHSCGFSGFHILDNLIKLTILDHLFDNIKSTNKLAIHVQLRKSFKISQESPRVGAYVGQSEKVFRPCLTSSSARILKKPYRTFFSRRMPTIVREKPHWGADGVPFMKSMTGAALTSLARRSLRSSSFGGSVVAEVADVVVSCAGGSEDGDVCNWRAEEREAGLAPETRVRIFEFLTRTKKGTDETSKVSDTSGSSSASIWFTIRVLHRTIVVPGQMWQRGIWSIIR